MRAENLITLIRSVLGMPNYVAYCAHVAAHHPDRVPLSESEFFADYLRTRYEGGPTRCC